MSKKRNVNEPVVETTENEVAPKEAETIETVVLPVGIVSGCKKLNVRTEPKIKLDNVKCTLEEGNTVQIVEKKSNKDWYAVVTADNKPGYCMKKYITVQ